MRILLFLFILIGCFTIGPGNVVLCLLAIPMFICEMLYQLFAGIFGALPDWFVWVIIAFTVLLCILPFRSKGEKS